MLTIDLDALQAAKDLIDKVNSVPLNEIAWQRGGETMPVDLETLDAWRFTGLSNHCFAYDYLLTPNVELSGPEAGLSPEGPARTQGYATGG